MVGVPVYFDGGDLVDCGCYSIFDVLFDNWSISRDEMGYPPSNYTVVSLCSLDWEVYLLLIRRAELGQ